MNSKYWSYLYFTCLLVQLAAIAANWEDIRFFTKPLLMVILFSWFVLASPKLLPLRSLVAAALFFSWIGDVCLLQNGNGWFMAGLGSFLLAHIMYIIFFLRIHRINVAAPRLHIPLVMMAVAYAFSLFVFLYPYIGNLKIPVGIYAAVITCMLIAATHALSSDVQISRKLFIAGALLFVLSDSLLAINKFYQSLPAGNLGVMLTYALAQFALTKGSLLYLAENKNRLAEPARPL